MKVLKIIGLVFAKIALAVTVLLFMISLSASYVLENGISNLLLGGLPNVGEGIQYRALITEKIVSNGIKLEGVYNQVLDDLGITEEQLIRILESPVAKDLVTEFVETVLEDVSSGDINDFNLGEKVLDFVEDNKSEIEEVIGTEVPMEKVEKFAKSEEVSKFNAQYKDVVGKVTTKIPAPLKSAIKTVEKFISEDFRNSCLLVVGILLVIIALLQWSWYKWIRTIGNTILGCGIFVFVIAFLGNIFSSLISNIIGMNTTLEFSKAVYSSLVSVGLGATLLIIYSIIKKLASGGKKNEISQNVI